MGEKGATMRSYIQTKAGQFLSLGADRYRCADSLNQPDECLDAEELATIARGLEQIVGGAGFAPDTPLVDIGVDGLLRLAATFHCDLAKIISHRHPTNIVDECLLRHWVMGRTVTIFNEVPLPYSVPWWWQGREAELGIVEVVTEGACLGCLTAYRTTTHHFADSGLVKRVGTMPFSGAEIHAFVAELESFGPHVDIAACPNCGHSLHEPASLGLEAMSRAEFHGVADDACYRFVGVTVVRERAENVCPHPAGR